MTKCVMFMLSLLVLCVAPHIAAGGMGTRTGAGVGGGNQYPVSSALDLLAETES